MSSRTKAQTVDDQGSAEEQAERPVEDEATRCGAPHQLPLLAHVTCQLDAEELEPGAAGHEHRHEDGDTVYTWR
ncbi:hypothetical protein [Streptomyces sp. NPDC059828]|uniref:hypothetical protein n=1 Tax=Streptomyces sp. NPDC059828 TaxID=3346965 RepID=UPI00365A8028